MRVLIAGASGALGTALRRSLEADGHSVVTLVRRKPADQGEFEWDPPHEAIDRAAFAGVDAVVNLTGAPIGDRRWSDDRKLLLRQSRIGTTKLLADVVATLDAPPRALVNQSAIGIYGDRGDEVLTEASPLGPDDDFLAVLTKDWEEATRPAAEAGVRVACTRTGLVLIPGIQLLGRLVPLFKAGLGGPIGGGRQWWSWVTLPDQVRAMRHLIESDLAGPFNVVAPNPVRQKDFARILGSVLGRPAAVPTPGFAIKARLGSEAGASIGLGGARVMPRALLDSGFEFESPQLQPALAEMFATSR